LSDSPEQHPNPFFSITFIHTIIYGGEKKAYKIFKHYPKRRGFFPYKSYSGNFEGRRREGGEWTSFFIKSNEFEGMLLFSSHGRLPFEQMRAPSVSDDVITSYNFA
jgi:hypothetical protein